MPGEPLCFKREPGWWAWCWPLAFMASALMFGDLERWWPVWLVLWLSAHVSGVVGERLIFWQHRYIEALVEARRLDKGERGDFDAG